jgi:Mannosylglycerate hydrolase MGH1-like glycoside hydrolase domain
MIPHDDFTPHGYLDNPYHSWKLNPSGVLRSLPPLGMGWHVPNLGSYARNQFQYSAHVMIGLKIGDLVLVTARDFDRHHCVIMSHLHTKNRFEYTCVVPQYDLTLTARYFLVQEHALGCVLSLSTRRRQSLPVTCYLTHLHTHNPATSRLWEHGLYAFAEQDSGTPLAGTRAVLGLASEGDAFIHGVRAADGTALTFGEIGYAITLDEIAAWARDRAAARPAVTQHQDETGWQLRALALPCTVTLGSDAAAGCILNAVLARGVSQDQARQHWEDGMEEIAHVGTAHHADDEQFWSHAPQLSGNWPATWRRGFVYDLETLRMVIRPSAGVIPHAWDGMQIQAPREVLAEAAMDTFFLSYADPELASEVILGHFESAPHANLPCMREDGSYNMVADDGRVCGTAPAWGFPLWCCDQIVRRTGDLHWLRRLYPKAAAHLRWWLENRRDAEGWSIYACSWESGQDVSSRFGPQQTGGTVIQHVRPVDLQASMVQGAAILARWATLLGQNQTIIPTIETPIDFAAEAAWWQHIANEFTVKLRLMWQNGWFRDYDAAAQEWSSQQDTMHLAPIFCGAAGWEQIEQLRPSFAQPPAHSGWAPLSWPPVVMTLVGAALAAQLPLDAAELAYRYIDAAYRSIDSRELDQHGGLPGVTREYHAVVTTGKWRASDYVNAGIEGYGWGALSIHLLMRYLLGLREEEAGVIKVAPVLPQALRRVGATYHAGPVPWGKYLLHVECTVRDAQGYSMRVRCTVQTPPDALALLTPEPLQEPVEQRWEWEGAWSEERTLRLS